MGWRDGSMLKDTHCQGHTWSPKISPRTHMVEGDVDFLKFLTLPIVHPIHSNTKYINESVCIFYSKMIMFERFICLTWFKHYTVYKPSNVPWYPINTCYFIFFLIKINTIIFLKKSQKGNVNFSIVLS